jgi:hypothetical protein
MPFGPRKSGMPDSVDMPAPVNAMAYLLFAKSLAARLIKSSIIYPKIIIIVAKSSLFAKLIKKRAFNNIQLSF